MMPRLPRPDDRCVRCGKRLDEHYELRCDDGQAYERDKAGD